MCRAWRFSQQPLRLLQSSSRNQEKLISLCDMTTLCFTPASNNLVQNKCRKYCVTKPRLYHSDSATRHRAW